MVDFYFINIYKNQLRIENFISFIKLFAAMSLGEVSFTC